ncbi:uncharacterized protein LOC106653480 [Trichogramma pretiosum]|uniref:uncharacterized protein LOC106653480 n=1 Tax=Trichogramma pretiosum TaxID=7493 RepID=UPI0006C9DCA8|nr:uncharacterized protein LOC106653480 [Trichogramma pretiosum]
MASRDRRTSSDQIDPNNRVEEDQSDDETPSNDEESRSSPPARAHVNEAFESDEPQPSDPAPTSEGDGQHQEAGPSRRRSLIDEAGNVSVLTQRRGSNQEALQSRAANPAPPRQIQPAEEPERRFQPAEGPPRQEAEWNSPPPDYEAAQRYDVHPPSYEDAQRQMDQRPMRAPHCQQRARDIQVNLAAAARPTTTPPRRPARPSGRQLELYPTEGVRRSVSNTGKRCSRILIGVALLAVIVVAIAVIRYLLSLRASTHMSPAEHDFDILREFMTTTTVRPW